MKSKNNDNIESVVDDVQSVATDDLTLQEQFEELKTAFEQLKDQMVDSDNKLKRALADYQNLEKRVAEGRAELANWATGELIKKLLPIMNNFDQVRVGVKEEEKTGWYKGFEMSLKQLQDLFRSEGLEEIETDGQFDPALHEAVDTREGENGKIVETLEKGYLLGGKIIKPAKVVVGKEVK